MTGPHVQLLDVVKRFSPTVAVAGVSLDIARGSLTTILGPSGCGKTTLLRLMGGFLEPDTGEIRIAGVPQGGRPPYLRSTATVFQEYALFPHMTVFENVAYGLRVRGLTRAAVADRVRRALALGSTGWTPATRGSSPAASSSASRSADRSSSSPRCS